MGRGARALMNALWRRGRENSDYGRYFAPPAIPAQSQPRSRFRLDLAPSRSARSTRHALVLDSLRHASISTRSPALHSLFSSCAWYLFELADDLAVERMLDAALDQHGDRLVHLVADDAAGQRLDERLARRRGLALARVLVCALFAHALAVSLFCAACSVRTRAMLAPHLLQLRLCW